MVLICYNCLYVVSGRRFVCVLDNRRSRGGTDRAYGNGLSGAGAWRYAGVGACVLFTACDVRCELVSILHTVVQGTFGRQGGHSPPAAGILCVCSCGVGIVWRSKGATVRVVWCVMSADEGSVEHMRSRLNIVHVARAKDVY